MMTSWSVRSAVSADARFLGFERKAAWACSSIDTRTYLIV
jgi:hypothetical protein